MKGVNNYFVAVKTEGKFTLWINQPVYKEYFADEGMKIVNIKTGENMGNNVKLHTHFYDANLRRLPEAIQDEDCYDFVRK